MVGAWSAAGLGSRLGPAQPGGVLSAFAGKTVREAFVVSIGQRSPGAVQCGGSGA